MVLGWNPNKKMLNMFEPGSDMINTDMENKWTYKCNDWHKMRKEVKKLKKWNGVTHYTSFTYFWADCFRFHDSLVNSYR